MKNIVRSLTLSFLTVVFFSFHSAAASLPQVTGVSIDGNILTWAPQEGAVGYNIYLDLNYHNTVRDIESFTVSVPGLYHVVSFNDNGEFGVIRDPDNGDLEFSAIYEGGGQPGSALCSSNAQDIGLLTGPFLINDSLGFDAAESRVDFYRFEAARGLNLVANVLGLTSGQGDLLDPIIGLFDSNCRQIAQNDDLFGADPSIQFSVPADGVFSIAVARFPDFDFDGTLSTSGGNTYTLSIDLVPPNIEAISARLINAATGDPLTGDQPLFANAELYLCNINCDSFVDIQFADNNGIVRFSSNNLIDLPAGTYQIRAFANEFDTQETERFTVNEGDEGFIGDIELTAPNIAIDNSNIRTCDSISFTGGTCRYEFEILNTSNTILSVLVWSTVVGNIVDTSVRNTTIFEAMSLSSADENATRFQVDIPALSSVTASFTFNIPATVPGGSEFCQSAFVGLDPNPLFDIAIQSNLFCVIKTFDSFQILDGIQMSKTISRHNETAIKSQQRSMGITSID